MPKPDRAAADAALHIVHNWVHAKLVIIERRAQDTAASLGCDASDVYDVLRMCDGACVFDMSPDHRFPDRTVLEMKVAAFERDLYVKISMRLDKDYDVKVLSFKESGR